MKRAEEKLTEREELIRAGFFGVHEVVVYSLNRILLHEADESKSEQFAVYCEAVVSFLLLFLRNNDEIFLVMKDWNAIPDFDKFHAERPSRDVLVELLNKAEEVCVVFPLTFYGFSFYICFWFEGCETW
jgi:hypothetical protein